MIVVDNSANVDRPAIVQIRTRQSQVLAFRFGRPRENIADLRPFYEFKRFAGNFLCKRDMGRDFHVDRFAGLRILELALALGCGIGYGINRPLKWQKRIVPRTRFTDKGFAGIRRLVRPVATGKQLAVEFGHIVAMHPVRKGADFLPFAGNALPSSVKIAELPVFFRIVPRNIQQTVGKDPKYV